MDALFFAYLLEINIQKYQFQGLTNKPTCTPFTDIYIIGCEGKNQVEYKGYF